jgi:hypothetical protein
MDSWWWWPDPTQVANHTQRLYTGAPIALNLQEFTEVVMLRPLPQPTTNDPAISHYGGVPMMGFCVINQSWHFDVNVGNWEAWTSNDNNTPTNKLQVTPVNVNVADTDTMLAFAYKYIAPFGETSEGLLYINQTGQIAETDSDSDLDGPPAATVQRKQIFGCENTACLYGRSYWYAIITRKLTLAELNDYHTGVKSIEDDPDLDFYIDFTQTPAATIVPNIDNLGIGNINVHNWANIIKNGP